MFARPGLADSSAELHMVRFCITERSERQVWEQEVCRSMHFQDKCRHARHGHGRWVCLCRDHQPDWILQRQNQMKTSVPENLEEDLQEYEEHAEAPIWAWRVKRHKIMWQYQTALYVQSEVQTSVARWAGKHIQLFLLLWNTIGGRHQVLEGTTLNHFWNEKYPNAILDCHTCGQVFTSYNTWSPTAFSVLAKMNLLTPLSRRVRSRKRTRQLCF